MRTKNPRVVINAQWSDGYILNFTYYLTVNHNPCFIESMIFRLSKKLGDKIKVNPKISIPEHDNPYADWSAHLFNFLRRQIIIVSNTKSLYSVLIEAKGITDQNKFVSAVLSKIQETILSDGFEFHCKKFVEPEINNSEVIFSKNTNRQVIGSINEQIFFAKVIFSQDTDISFKAVSSEINRNILSLLDYNKPREAFGNMKY